VDAFEISENLYSMISNGQSYEVDVIEREKTYQVFVKGKSIFLSFQKPAATLSSPISEA